MGGGTETMSRGDATGKRGCSARGRHGGEEHTSALAASDAPHLLVVVARQFSSAWPGETHTCGLVRRGGARRARGRQGALRAPRRGEACSMRFPDIRNKRARAPGGLGGVAHREDAPQRRRQRSIMARWKHDVGHGCLSCQRVTPASIGCVSPQEVLRSPHPSPLSYARASVVARRALCAGRHAWASIRGREGVGREDDTRAGCKGRARRHINDSTQVAHVWPWDRAARGGSASVLTVRQWCGGLWWHGHGWKGCGAPARRGPELGLALATRDASECTRSLFPQISAGTAVLASFAQGDRVAGGSDMTLHKGKRDSETLGTTFGPWYNFCV